ncbi:MAG: APC family permease [Drouetiella hepatica Uher 2000/2452]|jgi:amino acid transporter|uniref:APC family permease n=1 Tax=Drouetiella hepatica Uher 2000/2452 TaxID=904376 RepID=A0A951QGQ3_9CYAN|nr:APC family permease [Drouetiella hepatica Uher 2000/2452]
MAKLEVKPRVSGLRPDCLPFSEVISQSIANIAPSVTPTVNAALVFASAGTGTWFTYVLATIGLTFVGLNINQFAKRSASPGSLYAYIARGLGPMAGVLTGWALVLAYVLTAMAVVSGFASYGAVVLGAIGINPSPIFLFAICVGIAWYVGYKDIKLSTVIMLVLEAVSVGLIIILGMIILGEKGYVIDPAQLTLQDAKPGGIVLGLVLGVFSYVGFESATTLGDEAKQPLRNIPRAVISSTIICGIFFVFMSYIEVLGFQGAPVKFNESAAPMSDLANFAGVGFFGVLIAVGATVSMFACALASINAGARIFFSMGRHGIFHRSIGRAHGRNETPHVAITLFALATFLVPTIMNMVGVRPLDIYAYTGTIATYGFLVAYILISIAAPIYLRREHQLRWTDVLSSILAIGFMLIPVLGSIGLPGENSIFPVPTAPYNVFPYLFLVYMIVGAVWFLILRSRSPNMIQEMENDIEASHTRFSEMKKV